MAIDITSDYQYLINQKLQREHDGLIDKEIKDVEKITKECVDKLIEDIDRILKKASI